MRNDKHAGDSRRQVQRRFPPGAFGVNAKTCLLFTVMGWVPSQTTVWTNGNGSGQPSQMGPGAQRRAQKVASHDAVILIDGRLVNMNWESMAVEWTLPEWEEAFADAA